MNWNAYPTPELLPPTSGAALPQEHTTGRETPTLLETVAFFTLAAILLIGIQGVGAGIALHWHLFGHMPLKKLVYQTRFTIPMTLLCYATILWVAAMLFRRVWSAPFSVGIHWNLTQVQRFWPWLVGIGLGLGFGIQLASNFLPVPKEMPINAFFRTPLDVWMVALFGTFLAPIAEEIAFRGFLYPSLRHWTGRVIAAILTSIPFALLHGQQVAHAWGPLAMVFLVSLTLCAVRERTGSLAASALVHACYNLSIFMVIFYASGGFMHLERLKD
jgi:membrane protease YdiL (CAAX protease family)